MTALGAALLVVVLLALAGALAYVMLIVFAHLIGWSALVKRFGYAHDYRGAFERSSGVLIGRNAWNAPPLRVGLDAEGIVLRPIAVVRGAFGVVRLPWSAIVRTERRSFMFFDTMTLYYGTAPGESIAFLAGSVADQIEAHREKTTA
jgi:hypothetical protein